MRLLFVRTRSRVQSDVHQSVECWSSVNFTIAIYLTPRVRSKNRINADFQLVYNKQTLPVHDFVASGAARYVVATSHHTKSRRPS